MRFWNTIFLLLFLNITALPSIAAVCDWDIPSAEIVLEEEEEESIKDLTLIEKRTPEEFNTDKFINITLFQTKKRGVNIYKEPKHLAPYLNLFSPPPEFKI